ncbi:MAG: hypothetical protein E7588_00555 [Ruminococcaceae bacterium]|nr:hypothetical protein [Oscillospiraceae bacterium]
MFPLKDKRIRIGGWWSTDPKLISDEYVKAIAENGCDFIMTSQLSDTAKIKELLSYCDKYGVECIVYDQRLYDREDVDVASITKEYSGYKSYVGNMVKDEPGTDEFPHLRRVYDKFRAETPGKDAYINLLPMYANAAQLKYGAGAAAIKYYDKDPDLYKKHLEDYCEAFDTPYLCVDVYPCRNAPDGVTRTIYNGYLENVSLMAETCRKYNREMWIMVQSLVWYANATPPDEIDLRWQFYTVLAFGAKAIFHYCLATPPGHTPGLLTSEGTKSDLYYPAQRCHRFLHAIEDVYYQYNPVGAFNVNCTDEYEYLKFSAQYKNFAPIKEVVSDDQLLVGCFEKQDNKGYAFTIVNMTQISERKTARAKLKIEGKKVTVYADTMSYTIAPVDGYYEFDLPCGEGAFVTVE